MKKKIVIIVSILGCCLFGIGVAFAADIPERVVLGDEYEYLQCCKKIMSEYNSNAKFVGIVGSDDEVRQGDYSFSDGEYMYYIKPEDDFIHCIKAEDLLEEPGTADEVKQGMSEQLTTHAVSMTEKYVEITHDLKTDTTTDKGMYRVVVYEVLDEEYRTGAYGSFLYNENGEMLSANFSQAVISEVREQDMVSKEHAFDVAVEKIIEKYGDEVSINQGYEETEMEILTGKNGLYYYMEIEGIYQDMEVSFYPSIDVYTADITEIASTLGY